MTKLYHTDFPLTLRVVTREGDPPPAVVMRRVLKALRRTHDVRCVSLGPGGSQDAQVEELPDDQDPVPEDPDHADRP